MRDLKELLCEARKFTAPEGFYEQESTGFILLVKNGMVYDITSDGACVCRNMRPGILGTVEENKEILKDMIKAKEFIGDTCTLSSAYVPWLKKDKVCKVEDFDIENAIDDNEFIEKSSKFFDY